MFDFYQPTTLVSASILPEIKKFLISLIRLSEHILMLFFPPQTFKRFSFFMYETSLNSGLFDVVRCDLTSEGLSSHQN